MTAGTPNASPQPSRFDPAAWVLNHGRFAAVIVLLFFALGLFALSNISRTEDPVLEIPEFAVTVVLPGADPATAEQQLAKPIENAIYRLDGVEEVRSFSGKDIASVAVRFRWGTNVAVAYNELQREMDALRSELPPSITNLEVIRYSNNRVAIRVVALVSDTLPTRQLDKLTRRLSDRVGAIPGIREVRITGIQPTEVAVELDTTKLAAMSLDAESIIAALAAAGADAPVGSLNTGSRSFNVKFQGSFGSLNEIRNVAIPLGTGTHVRVGEIAKVGWASADVPDIARFNGKRAVLLALSAADGQDIERISSAIDVELEQFKRSLPGGVKIAAGFDQSTNIATRIDRLERDFIIALVLVSITLLPIGLRAGIVVMIAIPLSLLFGVLTLFISGFTLNQLSIAGFVLSIGLLVDDSIVVVENIARWLRNGAGPLREAVAGATRQVSTAVLGSTACLIFAFIPLAALPGVSGAFIRSLPVAVFATVIGSLIVALTVIPLAAKLILRDRHGLEGSSTFRLVNVGINRFYSPVLQRALAAPKMWLGVLYFVSLLAVPAVMIVGTSLFPKADLPEFLIDVNVGQGATIARTDEIVRLVEAKALEIPEVRWVTTNIGKTGPRIYYNLHEVDRDPGFAQVAVGLAEWDKHKVETLFTHLREEFSRIPGASVEIVELKQGNIVEAPIAIRISGQDVEQLVTLASETEAALKDTPGLIDITNPLRRQRSDIQLVVDDVELAARGVLPGTVREALRIALSGARPASLRDQDGDEWPLVVSLPRNEHDSSKNVSDLHSIYVASVEGDLVPLTSLAKATLVSGPPTINRVDRVRTVTLTANVEPGLLVGRATDAAMKRIDEVLTLPPGYKLALAGEAEETGESFGNLGPALILALFGILAVLVLEFGNLRNVAVVFGILPFGFFGAVIALLITGNSLSFTATIGLVALIGIEIKNSILLVDFTEHLRGQGMELLEAVKTAGEVRFLPVLLTSITAIGGMLPLALSSNGLYSPLAIVLIGGLISSTVLGRIATPAMYLLVAKGERM